MNTKVSPHRFWPCHENGLIKTLQTIPHNLYVSFKLTSLYYGSRIILVYPNPQLRESDLTLTYWYRLNRLDEPLFMAGPKPMRTEFGIHQRLESCDDMTSRIIYDFV